MFWNLTFWNLTFCGCTSFALALQRKCNVFLFWELHGLRPNFHIHVSVNDLYIPRIGPHISCSRIGRSVMGIYIAHRHRNVKIRTVAAQILFWEYLFSNFRYWFFTVWKRWLKVEHFRMMMFFSPGLCWECQHWAARTAGWSWLVLDGKRCWRPVHCSPAPDNKGIVAKDGLGHCWYFNGET